MRRARFLITMGCAFVLAAVLMVPGVRADEYTKLTYLTFSGPVQVPGVTLPAGTYMFKLADPAGGRRAIQIWDEKGTKMYTMLLTIPDEQLEAKDDPVVLFSERPSGSPHAVKSWFYPAERIGYEFIYPKSQAMKIASDAKTPVLAYNDEQKSDADENALRGAQVGRIDGQGQAAADTTAPSSSTTTTASTAPASNAPAAATAQNDPAPRPQSAPATTASASTATAATTAAPEGASANRTPPPAPAATSTTTTSSTTTAGADRAAAAAPSATASTRATTAGADRAVGTSGSQAAQSQNAAPRNELPRTASPLATIQLMSLALMGGAVGMRQLRRRLAENR